MPTTQTNRVAEIETSRMTAAIYVNLTGRAVIICLKSLGIEIVAAERGRLLLSAVRLRHSNRSTFGKGVWPSLCT